MGRYLIKADEAFIKSFNKIQKSINKIYGCGLEPETYAVKEKHAQDMYERLAAIVDIDELNSAMDGAFPNGMRKMMDYDSVIMAGAKLSEAVSAYASHAEQPYRLSEIDFIPVFINEFISTGFFSYSMNIAYKMTQKELEPGGDEMNSPTPEIPDLAEFENTIYECIIEPDLFREKFTGMNIKKKLQYCRIAHILYFLCAFFIRQYIQVDIGSPVVAHKASNVRKIPQEEAEVICRMKENTEAIILENVILYYKIAFIDEDGIKKEGYVIKRNLKLLNA